MRRRSFFKSIAGLVASPVLAKLPALPAPKVVAKPVSITPEFAEGYAINVRAMYQRELGRWFARQMDECMFAELTREERRA